MKPPASAIAALLDGSHADPFSLLGPHEGPEGTFARAILHGAEEAEAFSLKGGKLEVTKTPNAETPITTKQAPMTPPTR